MKRSDWLLEMDRRDWERVQELEWAYQARKRPERVLALNRIYWQRLLAETRKAGVRIGPGTRVLDAGCGGAGILLALEQGERVGIDPLMDRYLERFDFLAGTDIVWLRACVEDYTSERPFDIVFCINVLDHTRDPGAAARRLQGLLAEGGHLVVLVNLHRSALARRYYALLQRYVDPTHPQQMDRSAALRLFAGLSLVYEREADSLWSDLDARYRREVLGCRRRGRAGKLLAKVANPLAWPPALLGLARWPVHGRALFSSRLFVFRRIG
ncbi:MAG: methyltransferase domain-containing protein [Deltaproteobacteria bacterium]|nr:methyltransferase domain-containing protein [Deltaproteobacteria bacterium]